MTVKKYINGRREDVDYLDASLLKVSEVKEYIARRHGPGKYILYEYNTKTKRPISNTVIIDDNYMSSIGAQISRPMQSNFSGINQTVEQMLQTILDKLIDIENMLIESEEEEKEEEKEDEKLIELMHKIPDLAKIIGGSK